MAKAKATKAAAKKATAKGESIHKMNIEVTPEHVFYAMKATDKIGKTISKDFPRASYE